MFVWVGMRRMDGIGGLVSGIFGFLMFHRPEFWHAVNMAR